MWMTCLCLNEIKIPYLPLNLQSTRASQSTLSTATRGREGEKVVIEVGQQLSAQADSPTNREKRLVLNIIMLGML